MVPYLGDDLDWGRQNTQNSAAPIFRVPRVEKSRDLTFGGIKRYHDIDYAACEADLGC